MYKSTNRITYYLSLCNLRAVQLVVLPHHSLILGGEGFYLGFLSTRGTWPAGNAFSAAQACVRVKPSIARPPAESSSAPTRTSPLWAAEPPEITCHEVLYKVLQQSHRWRK